MLSGDWFLVGSQMQTPPLPVFPLQRQTLGSRLGPPGRGAPGFCVVLLPAELRLLRKGGFCT